MSNTNKMLTTKFQNRFKYFTGYSLSNFKSINNFTLWLHRPVDAAALGIFRMLFGAAMLIDIAEERGGSEIDLRFGDAKTCYFPLVDFIQPLRLPLMGLVYLIMWLGAFGICMGYKFRQSCFAFVITYWYIFLLNKPAWNNHSYLFGLCGLLLMMTNANQYCSLDNPLWRREKTIVPYWNYFLVKFQFFILYTYAGLKKFSAEWLSGYAMSSLGYHWIFTPFRSVLSADIIDLLIIHWFTAVFDFSIAFLMTFHKTRTISTPFMLSFHLMNSRLFTIGMFPWVCLAEVPLFFSFDWPRHIVEWNWVTDEKNEQVSMETTKEEIVEPSQLCLTISDLRKRKHGCNQKSYINKSVATQANNSLVINMVDKIRTLIILVYCIIQLTLPYSHFITKGYNNWTNGLYGYSWDMMVHSYDTVLTTVKIVDNNNQQTHYLEPFAFTHYDRWTKSADMAVQYAKCIKKNINKEIAKNPKKSRISATNISIYFDIWCSMNGRFQQRIFDPTVDLLKAEWSPFKKTQWLLPLLNELNHMRPKLKTITEEVRSWSNYSDVIFVADFPGLTLENFVSADLTNVSLSVIEGSISFQNESLVKHLRSGESISPTPGKVHQVETTSSRPSCYLYTYINKTMETLQISPVDVYEDKDYLPLWNEFVQRITNYQQFVYHIFNSIMYLFYGVPMPISIREL